MVTFSKVLSALESTLEKSSVIDLLWNSLDNVYEVSVVVVTATTLLLKWYARVHDWTSNNISRGPNSSLELVILIIIVKNITFIAWTAVQCDNSIIAEKSSLVRKRKSYVEKFREMPSKEIGPAVWQEIRIAAILLNQWWLRIGVHQNWYTMIRNKGVTKSLREQ